MNDIKTIETLHLGSKRCIELLHQAFEELKRNCNDNYADDYDWSSKIPVVDANTSGRYDSSSSDEEDNQQDASSGEESSSSSSSSSDEESSDNDEKQQQGVDVSDERQTQQTVHETFDDNDNKPKETKKKKKRTKKEYDQKQKEQLIQKHIDSITCEEFHVSNDENKNQILELPSCLLSKQTLQSNSMIHKCQEYISLCEKTKNIIIVIFIRSGRFAGAVYDMKTNKCLHHTTSTRYTIRKGQGKAQSNQDSQKRAKSMGSQLRRQQEMKLQDDIYDTLNINWKKYMQDANLILLSIPKTMTKPFFNSNEVILPRNDPRIRKVPLDVGKPSYETASLIYTVLTTVTIRQQQQEYFNTETTTRSYNSVEKDVSSTKENATTTTGNDQTTNTVADEIEKVVIPLSQLHIAAQNGDLDMIQTLLKGDENNNDTITKINQQAGEMFMTPLHYATMNDHDECVKALLIDGHADPTIIDIRSRVPYYLANKDKVRDTYRIVRGVLGEDYCNWDGNAKVGPALFENDILSKKEKEAEKRRRKRAKQKEKKAKEKAEIQEAEERKRLAEEQKLKEEEAKRIRDGLKPKIGNVPGICDFCQIEVKGRKRTQMYKRLNYSYCSTDCVQKHKRELMAKAATDRLNK